MAEFPSKVSTRTSSPAQGAGASVSALRPDVSFVRSILGALMLLQLVSGRGAPGDRGLRGGPPEHPIHSHPGLTRALTRRAYPGGAYRTGAPDVTLELSRGPVAVPASTGTVRPCSECPLQRPIVPAGGHQRPPTEALT